MNKYIYIYVDHLQDEFSESVAEFMQRNKLKIDLKLNPGASAGSGPAHTPCSEFVRTELRTPEDARSYSVFTSGYQSVDTLSDIDEFEETFKCLSVADKTRHYYTLFRDTTPPDSAQTTPARAAPSEPRPRDEDSGEAESGGGHTGTLADGAVRPSVPAPAPAHRENPAAAQLSNMSGDDVLSPASGDTHINQPQDTVDNKWDQGGEGQGAGTGLSPHYKLGDEPEPIDLTHLNIEAAMLCLASKVRSLAGPSPAPGGLQRVDQRQQRTEVSLEEEVRPSMRKLRQGMDSLLKTSRLVCSVLRLQQSPEAVRLTAEVRQRRDICFSQALSSLAASLVSRLWCRPPDPVFLSVLTSLGPVVCFEGLLSMHGEDVTTFNDMIVAIEDLRAVEFTLVKLEAPHPSPPLPIVSGSRSSLKVMVPLPPWATQPQPRQYIKVTVTVQASSIAAQHLEFLF